MAKSFTDSEVKWEMFILIFLEPLGTHLWINNRVLPGYCLMSRKITMLGITVYFKY